MTNERRLRSAIGARCLDVSDVIQKCGFSRQAFYNKMRNKTEFKPSEIICIAKFLCLTQEEVNAIFFAEDVDKISTNG